MTRYALMFSSELEASPERVWSWITSADGIQAEFYPIARMTFPPGLRSILDADVKLGRPLGRSWLLLFGILPIERSDLTLIEFHKGCGFVEESPMLAMRLWRHERWIDPLPGGSRITDRLTFEPRFAGSLVKAIVGALFRHRHAVLRRQLGGAGPQG